MFKLKKKFKHSWNLYFIACIRDFSSLINWKNDCKFLQKCQNIDSASVSSHIICLRFTNLVKEEKLRKDHNYPWCIVIAYSVDSFVRWRRKIELTCSYSHQFSNNLWKTFFSIDLNFSICYLCWVVQSWVKITQG